MNLLQLVNEVERESGTVSQSQRLTTVVGASGRQEKIVQWVVQAWQDIQGERRDWTFRRKQFSGALTIGQAGYTAAELGITDFGGWDRDLMNETGVSLYDSTIGRSDEVRIALIPWPRWVETYDIGSPENMRPIVCSIGYDNKLYFGNPPDAAYVARGWYHRSLQTLSANTDEPIIEEDYHSAIVWRALMYLAQHDEAEAAYNAALANYRGPLNRLVNAHTPAVELT